MKINYLDYIPEMQCSCKICGRNGFKVIHARPNQLRRRREVSDPLTRTILWNFHQSLRRPQIGIMKDLHLTDPNQMELQNELCEEWKKEFRQSGMQESWREQKPWSVFAIFKKCSRLTGRQPKTLWTLVQNTIWEADIEYHQKTKVECGTTVLPGMVRSWTRNLLTVDTEDPQSIPPSEIHVKKRPETKEVEILKRNDGFVFLCNTGEILQEGQPLLTNINKAKGDATRESHQHSSSSRSRCRSSTRFPEHYEKLHISESCCLENKAVCSTERSSDTSELHWCPETNETDHWCTSWDNHRWLLEYRWRQVIVWTLDRCYNTRIAPRTPTRSTYVGSKASHKETGYYKTWTHFARRIQKMIWMRTSWTTRRENWKSGETQRYVAKSPHQSTRTVQIGSDPVQILVQKSDEKTEFFIPKQVHGIKIIERLSTDHNAGIQLTIQ